MCVFPIAIKKCQTSNGVMQPNCLVCVNIHSSSGHSLCTMLVNALLSASQWTLALVRTGCLIFMVCSITYHYKYLLWFTLLSGSFSLSYPGDVRHRQLLVSQASLWFSLYGLRRICLRFISYLFCALGYCFFFPHFLCFTIRLLMVALIWSVSPCVSLCISYHSNRISAYTLYIHCICISQ